MSLASHLDEAVSDERAVEIRPVIRRCHLRMSEILLHETLLSLTVQFLLLSCLAQH